MFVHSVMKIATAIIGAMALITMVGTSYNPSATLSSSSVFAAAAEPEAKLLRRRLKAKNQKKAGKAEKKKNKNKNKNKERSVSEEAMKALYEKACGNVCKLTPSEKICKALNCKLYETVDIVMEDAKASDLCKGIKTSCKIGDCAGDECSFYSQWCTANTQQNWGPKKMGCECGGNAPKECKDGTCIADWQCCPEDKCENDGPCCPTGQDCCDGACCEHGCDQQNGGCKEECSGHDANGNCCPGTECGGPEGGICCRDPHTTSCIDGTCQASCSVSGCPHGETCCLDGECYPEDCCPEHKCGGFDGRCCIEGIEICKDGECKTDCAFAGCDGQCCEDGTCGSPCCKGSKECNGDCIPDGQTCECGKYSTCCPGSECTPGGHPAGCCQQSLGQNIDCQQPQGICVDTNKMADCLNAKSIECKAKYDALTGDGTVEQCGSCCGPCSDYTA